MLHEAPPAAGWFNSVGLVFSVSLLLVWSGRWHGRLSMEGVHGVQKLHTTPVPRVGGLAVEARFVLLGDVASEPGSRNREDMEGWVREGLVEWPGHVAVRPWLEQTRVYVLPSYREGAPRSTQEAMTIGRPVIATDVPGCRGRCWTVLTIGRESRRLAEERFDALRISEEMLGILTARVPADRGHVEGGEVWRRY